MAQVAGVRKPLVGLTQVETAVHTDQVGGALQLLVGQILGEGVSLAAANDHRDDIHPDQLGQGLRQGVAGILRGLPGFNVAQVGNAESVGGQVEFV